MKDLKTIKMMSILLVALLTTLTTIEIFFFSIIDYLNKNSGYIGVFLGVFAIFVAYVIFKKTVRPIVFIEIKEYTSGNIATLYNLVISNVGNIPAKNIEYTIIDENNAFNYDYKNDSFSILDIKNMLNGSISYLLNGNVYSGALFESNPNNSPLIYANKSETKFVKILLTYECFISNEKYKSIIFLKAHSKEKSLTSYSYGQKK